MRAQQSGLTRNNYSLLRRLETGLLTRALRKSLVLKAIIFPFTESTRDINWRYYHPPRARWSISVIFEQNKTRTNLDKRPLPWPTCRRNEARGGPVRDTASSLPPTPADPGFACGAPAASRRPSCSSWPGNHGGAGAGRDRCGPPRCSPVFPQGAMPGAPTSGSAGCAIARPHRSAHGAR